ncbi:MazG-like family protein [Priestia aryabhattai]|uniref:MazG-like family protein n=1 Tax=Priestia aryabhattai TaxID=412384 RepID=UPI001C528821|nr:MazG-like family protein [Priestia aryabhattai]
MKNNIIAENTKETQLMVEINKDVLQERVSQNTKWGHQRHPMGAWLAILAEEFGEVSQAMQSKLGLTSMKDSDADDLYKELIQVAAVASAIAEQVKEEAGGA